MEQKDLANMIETVVTQTLKDYGNVPIAVSNRHAHLSSVDLERLFGKGYQLTKLKDLSQPGQYACHETVKIIGEKNSIKNVRILGPPRGETQVEISKFDSFTLGCSPPIRDSGDLNDSEKLVIQGPRGQISLDKGLIIAARHIHMQNNDAEFYQVQHGQRVQVEVGGERGVIFRNVLIRVSPKYRLEMHIDVDEANAALIQNGEMGRIIPS